MLRVLLFLSKSMVVLSYLESGHLKQVLCKKGRGAIRVLQAKMFAEAEKVLR